VAASCRRSGGCEPGFAGLTCSGGFFSPVALDVDEVLVRLVGVAVLLDDVEVTFAVCLSVLPPASLLLLVALDVGTSISFTLTTVFDLDLTPPSPLAAEVGLDAELTAFAALLLTGDDGAAFSCRLAAASLVLLATAGLLSSFWSSEGISICWRVVGARALVRLRVGDADCDSSTLSRPSLTTERFSVVVRCFDDDDDVSLTFPGDVPCVESVPTLSIVVVAAKTTASAAAAAAA